MSNMSTATVGSTVVEPMLVGEASRVLGVSAETVRAWAKRGRIGALRTSHGVRLFDRRDVERLAHERNIRLTTPAA